MEFIAPIVDPCVNGIKACGDLCMRAVSFCGRPVVVIYNTACKAGQAGINGTVALTSSVFAKLQPLLGTCSRVCFNPTTACLAMTAGAVALGYQGYNSQEGNMKMAMIAGAVTCSAIAIFAATQTGFLPF